MLEENLKKDDEIKLLVKDIFIEINSENIEERLNKLIKLLQEDSLKQFFIKCFRRKCVIPLRNNTSRNVKKLYLIKDDKLPRESCNLLNQSYMTIKNVHKLVKCNCLVDSNTLIRSAFENLIMGMMIYLDSNVYEEFKKLGLKDEDRCYTKQQKLRNLFKNQLKVINKDMFENMSNRQIQKMLDEFYNKLCFFTHSTLIVNGMVEVILNEDEELFLIIVKQNMYFLEILLNCCLKYITKNTGNQLKYEYWFIGWMILILSINRKKYTQEYLSKYNGLLYEDVNMDFIFQSNRDLKLLQKEIENLDEVIKENPSVFVQLIENLLD